MFAGSVFSPSYAARLRRGEAVSGLQVPALNLAVYSRGPGDDWPRTPLAWVMNEHPAAGLRSDDTSLQVGASAVRYLPDGGLRFELDEDTTRFFGRAGPRLTGHVTVAAPPPPGPPLLLGEDERGAAHFWQPLCPRSPAAVELVLGERRVAFRGTAYCDRNYGAGRLEDAFARWGWAHGFVPEGSGAVMVYDAVRRTGSRRRISVYYSEHAPGAVVNESVEPSGADPGGLLDDRGGFLWLRVPRTFSAGPFICERRPDGCLLDAPFYARFVTRIRPVTAVGDAPAPSYLGVGEYLDLERFRSRVVQHLLRYKTRRVPARTSG